MVKSRRGGVEQMLILTRRIGEKIIIDHNIEVVVAGIKGNQVRLAINAPKDISVHREEIEKKVKKQEVLKNDTSGTTKIVYKKSFTVKPERSTVQ
jgi:carbon storage regulator